MERYPYKSYEEYLDVQYRTNEPRVHLTLEKEFLRKQDIENIKKHFQGRKILCLGCRTDAEVESFENAGFDAIGIDILPTKKQIQGDMHELGKYFKPNQFDLVYSAHSLEHTYDLPLVLNNIRVISTEGLYLVIPIRDNSDIEEPVFLNVMQSKSKKDILSLCEYLGDFIVSSHKIRDDSSLPSGAEMFFVLKWF